MPLRVSRRGGTYYSPCSGDRVVIEGPEGKTGTIVMGATTICMVRVDGETNPEKKVVTLLLDDVWPIE